ncbi:hypothetical protein ACMU_05955 [Actibacterium mucosum KCTC 23349]|uniref:SMP-30/Gluconolactonase/LRE-like region domain-containing protein n=1 Tax=Actibacterium mucosum KCTC 23349 TaxID=1454373 RepID=A0A037ZLH4_9RHOB|nr:hypothetical protein ACMU_05955 [Actibacterium mucosum KCTC 23349]
MTCTTFDARKCTLGEGPFWHPLLGQLFWFDIPNRKLMTTGQDWALPVTGSAAGVIDHDRLLMATERGVEQFDLHTGNMTLLHPVEQDNAVTRSNDGRVDRQGGLWFSTMGWNAEPGAGAIYRYADGEVRQLHPGITIPNAICFAPNGGRAYFADTAQQLLFSQVLDRDTGWPVAAARVLVDFTETGLNPDGAITDTDGNVWIAMWGDASLTGIAPDGTQIGRIPLPAPHVTCPAADGDGCIYVTSALQGLPDTARAEADPSGKTFVLQDAFAALPDRPVLFFNPEPAS